MRTLAVVLGLVSLCVGLPLHAVAQRGAAAPLGTTLLRTYAGSYATDGLLGHARVRPRLAALLGTERAHLERNLGVRGSVDVIGGELSIEGNASHGGTEEEAVVCIGGDGPTVTAAIFSSGVITVYAGVSSYDAITRCIKDWITQVNSRHRDRLVQPANVRLARRP
jgi:hypothetical protein